MQKKERKINRNDRKINCEIITSFNKFNNLYANHGGPIDKVQMNLKDKKESKKQFPL